MTQPSWGPKNELTQIFRQPIYMFVLYLIGTGFCICLRDFERHFTGFAAGPLIEHLKSLGLIVDQATGFALTESGRILMPESATQGSMAASSETAFDSPVTDVTTARQQLGELLRRHRQAAQHSQRALAARAGVSVETISAIERGAARTIRAGVLQGLAEALDLSAHDRGARA